ncbi:MAG: GNAT family N-acetyltransferase [Desulfuromonadaceae bacterium]|nr:GNAT family N-acetyltransferase [Desulfuromonadaceae bacterium]
MLLIEDLEKKHDRRYFDCGEAALNTFLQTLARQQQDKGISKTFVLVDSAQPQTILGFFSLTACEVVSEDLPPSLARKYPARAPGAKLARLAIDRHQQRKGYGQLLMIEAMKKTLLVAENIGIIGFFVDAKSHEARVYYQQFGFISFREQPLEMFLPLATLRQAFAAVS